MPWFHREIPIAALFLAINGGRGMAVQPAADHAPQTHIVVIENMKFSPAVLQVSPGDAVEFRNEDLVPHNVTERSANTFDSGTIVRNAVWRFVFTQQGTFDYHCIYHPDMTGSIVVGAISASAMTNPPELELCGGL